MKKFEYVIPIDYEETRAALRKGGCTFVKRSRIEDVYFAETGGGILRLRRQDSVSKLACTKRLSLDGLEENHETIVIDHGACLNMLKLLGFREADRLRINRDSWKMHHYSINLDNIEGMGPFLVLECEVYCENELRMRRAAVKLLKSLGVKELEPDMVDNSPALAYTDPIVA